MIIIIIWQICRCVFCKKFIIYLLEKYNVFQYTGKSKKNERTTEYFNGLEGVNSGREVQGKIKALHN